MADPEVWKLPALSHHQSDLNQSKINDNRNEKNPIRMRGGTGSLEKLQMHNRMSKSEMGPFQIPSDEEVLRYYEIERANRSANKHDLQNSKIWEKQTFNTRNQLKHYKDFQVELDDNHKSKTNYSDGQKKLIQKALTIVKDRQTTQNLSGNKKESITEVLELKKEMFLVSMSHDILKGEIGRIHKQQEERQQSLISSEKMLKQDYDNFQKFLDSNKQQRVDAEMKADQANRQKRMKETQIKDLNLKLTTIRAEKARNEEILASIKEHKEFLDKLVPKEWEEEKQKEKDRVISELRQKYIESNLLDQQQGAEKNALRLKSKKDLNPATQNDKLKAQIIKLEQQFNQMAQNGEIEEIEEFENSYKMYFQTPSQLSEVFNTLEEKNLFLMQMKQEDEQNFEELKHQFKLEKQFLNNKSRALQTTKEQLRKQIEEINSGMSNIKQISEDRINKSDDKNEIKLGFIIGDLYNAFKDEIGLYNQESKPTLFALSQVENLFEKLFKEIKLCPIKIVEEKRKKAEKDRKQLQRDAQNERKKEELDRRNEKNRIKMTLSTKKKSGRLDMMRSAPFMKVITKDEDDNLNQIDEDMKYFRDDYKLL